MQYFPCLLNEVLTSYPVKKPGLDSLCQLIWFCLTSSPCFKQICLKPADSVTEYSECADQCSNYLGCCVFEYLCLTSRANIQIHSNQDHLNTGLHILSLTESAGFNQISLTPGLDITQNQMRWPNSLSPSCIMG